MSSQQQTDKDLAWRPALPDGHTQLSWYKPNPSEVFHPFLAKAAGSNEKPSKESAPKDQGKEAGKEPAAPQSHARRDHLREIELQVQKEWAAAKIHESHPPASDEKKREPFLVTFPYPYMNGVLHLGHAFTLSKAEFAARYQRLRGKNVLFPFGFHCTGMPIAACADKLKQEIETYGNPPNFPEEEDEPAPAEAAPAGDAAAAESKEEPKKKDKAKKGKVAKKKSTKKYQWDIMQEMGVPAEEIAKFRDATHWLQYFPPIGQTDLEAFGVMVDFRRSFITTEINPYYDAFIRWHFNTLKAKGKVDFGARLTIFSPSNGQPCADHDRASGEGVMPQEYTLIKLELKKPFPASLAAIEKAGKRVFLPAATLRPETMYGQTNCWVLPDGVYGAYEINDQELFVCSARSALNMSFQNITPVRGKPKQLCEVKGIDLMGHAVKAPLAQFPEVYILPLMTISMDKGTGVVTSVPSDAPDDWAALMDVKNKENLRTKYNIKPEMVMPFDVVPIIEVPGLGNTAAATLCVEKKVKSQNDKALLAEIKERTYMEGFYKGVMIVGPHKGKKVQDAKPLIRAEMIQRGEALAYAEPESQVIARNGDDCVVALTDQWFLPYGEAEWKAKVADHVNNKLECYNPATKKKFQETVDWLREWACSRSYGLGTKLPWDPKFVIESLSDSTIYMAYYTIAYELQGGVLDGSKTGPAGIDHKLLSDEVFNYIFLNKQHPTYPAKCGIPKEKLDKLRAQFEYWYPVALRVSGKDLIGNHLTMMIYNHTAIWDQEPERWPASFFCNGHVMINAEKMSKSLGNFLTIRECINEFSADATRLGLADAGDGLMDANFDKSTVNAAILRLTKEEEFIKEAWASMNLYRQGAPDTFVDQVFMNDINHAVAEATQCYDKMQYHEALRAGFFDLLNARDRYRLFYEGNSMNAQCLKRFIEVFLVMLSPICPHLTQSLWKLTGHKGFIADAEWPAAQPEDLVLTRKMKYLEDTGKNLRALSDKAKTLAAAAAKKGKPTPAPDSVMIFVAAEYPPWQLAVVQTLIDNQNAEVKLGRSELAREFAKKGAVAKKDQAKAMTFLAQLDEEVQTRGKDALELKLPFDEQSFLKEHLDYVTRGLEIPLERVKVENAAAAIENADAETRRAQAVPGQPSPYFFNAAEAAAKAANPAPAAGAASAPAKGAGAPAKGAGAPAKKK